MRLRYIIIAAFMCVPSLKSTFLPIAPSLEEKAIFHYKRKPLADINGCYRALLDACNLENTCGIENPYADSESFLKLLKSKKIDYQALHLVANTIPAIAKEHLDMHVFCINPGTLGSRSFSLAPFPKDLGKGVSAYESARIIDQERERQHKLCTGQIEEILKDSTKERVAIHFLYKADVLYLISLVQTKEGRALFCCNEDNRLMNAAPFVGNMCFDSVVFTLSTLASLFEVSSRQEFYSTSSLKGIQFPSSWSSVHQSYLEKGFEIIEPIIDAGARASRLVTTMGITALYFYGMYKYIEFGLTVNNRRW